MADEVLLDPRCVLIADGDGLDGAEVGERAERFSWRAMLLLLFLRHCCETWRPGNDLKRLAIGDPSHEREP